MSLSIQLTSLANAFQTRITCDRCSFFLDRQSRRPIGRHHHLAQCVGDLARARVLLTPAPSEWIRLRPQLYADNGLSEVLLQVKCSRADTSTCVVFCGDDDFGN